jgi:hypothetical protein
MRIRLDYIGFSSAFKIGALVHLVYSLILLIPYMFFTAFAPDYTGTLIPREVAAAMSSLSCMCVGVWLVLGTFLAGCAFAIFALIYNLISVTFGGLEIGLADNYDRPVNVGNNTPPPPQPLARSRYDDPIAQWERKPKR